MWYPMDRSWQAVFRSIKSNYSKNEIAIIKIRYNTTVEDKKYMDHKKLDIM